MADELKIWALQDGKEVAAVESVSGLKLEDILEETLVERPEMLEHGLQLVGRQTPTESGPLDLLGVDAGGRLVVFELKRGKTTREAVTQCIDYAAALNAMAPEAVATLIAENSGTDGIEEVKDFEEWYQERFAGNDLGDLLPPKLALVGLGVDERAERMARFLSAGGIKISVLAFFGFQHGGETLLARQVEVESSSATLGSQSGRLSIAERRKRLAEWLSECGLTDLFNTVCDDLRSSLPNCFEDPRGHGISFQLDIVGSGGARGPRTYFSVLAGYGEENSVTISFGVAALRENQDSFNLLEKELVLKDWPHGTIGRAVFVSNQEHWEGQREAVLRFVKATVNAWQEYRKTPQEAS